MVTAKKFRIELLQYFKNNQDKTFSRQEIEGYINSLSQFGKILKSDNNITTNRDFFDVIAGNSSEPTIKIKPAGLAYLEELLEEKSIEERDNNFKNLTTRLTNVSIELNTIQKITVWITLAIALCAASASIGSYQLSNRQHIEYIEVKSRNSQLLQMQIRLSQKDSILNSQHEKMDSLNHEIDSLKSISIKPPVIKHNSN